MVLIGSPAFGISYAVRLKKRKDNLKSIERILMYLESEIRYRHSLIYEAFNNAAVKADKPFSMWLLNLGESLYLYDTPDKDSFYEIWCDSLEMLRYGTCLTNEDIEELAAVGQTLGYLDIEAHKAGLALEIDHFHEKIFEYNQTLTGRMRVSVMAGAVFGILVVIVLV